MFELSVSRVIDCHVYRKFLVLGYRDILSCAAMFS